LLFDILSALKRWGFEQVFIFDLHGDVTHRGALLEGIREARIGCGTRAVRIMPRRYGRYAGLTGKEEHVLLIEDDANSIPFNAFTDVPDIHAGALETSFMQRFHPDQVDVERARTLPPTQLKPEDWKGWASGWSDARRVIPAGYNGDPARLNPQLAAQFMAAEAAGISKVIETYLSQPA
jgi:creatinine amidohydrolase